MFETTDWDRFLEPAIELCRHQPASPGDALYALDALRVLRRNVAVLDDEVVHLARQAGLTWNEIGLARGISKQAAWERWRHVERPRLNDIAIVRLAGRGPSSHGTVSDGSSGITLCGTHGRFVPADGVTFDCTACGYWEP